jgi:hypothetical protein
MKVAATWTLTADSESYYDVVDWLGDEEISSDQATLANEDNDKVTVQFSDLDTAFRFRMRFDEALING